jgi:hypothetical protein
MLLLPEGQAGETSEPAKQHVVNYVEKLLSKTNIKSCV